MSVKPFASLSSKGYIYGIVEKTDRTIATFFASDTNQDYIYQGSIANLSILVQQSGNDVLKFCESLRTVLERYLGNMYENAIVNVYSDLYTNLTGRINVTINVEVSENNERYNVANVLSLIDGQFEKITKLNNTGSIN